MTTAGIAMSKGTTNQAGDTGDCHSESVNRRDAFKGLAAAAAGAAVGAGASAEAGDQPSDACVVRNPYGGGPNTGTAVLLYHVLDQPIQTLDAGAGFRAWGFSAGLTLNGALLPTASENRADSWTDPLIAARYHRELGDGFGLTAYGDVGGFGVGAHVDWQVIGSLDYALKPWVALRLGYRSLNFNYTAANSIGFNVHMKGPLLAATFRF